MNPTGRVTGSQRAVHRSLAASRGSLEGGVLSRGSAPGPAGLVQGKEMQQLEPELLPEPPHRLITAISGLL